MKLQLSILLLMCSFGILKAQELPCKRYFPSQEGSGCKERYREDSNGMIHGKYISYFSDGSVDSRGEYIHGKKQGNWLEHIDFVFTYTYYFWYENGELIAQSNKEPFTSYAQAKSKAEQDARQTAKEEKAKIDSDYKSMNPCSFATNYPEDPRAEKAKRDCNEARDNSQKQLAETQRKAEVEKLEDDEVTQAVQSGTISGLRNYLSKYPNGRYKSDVEILIKRLELKELLFGKDNPIIDFNSAELSKNAATQLYSRYNFEKNPELSDTVFYYLLKWSADADDRQGLIKYYEIRNRVSRRIRKYHEWRYLKYKCEEQGLSKKVSVSMGLDSIKSLSRSTKYKGDSKLLLYKASMEVTLNKTNDAIETLSQLNAVNYSDIIFYKYPVDPFVIKSFILGYSYLEQDSKNRTKAKTYLRSFLGGANEAVLNAVNSFAIGELSNSYSIPSTLKLLLDKKLNLITRESLNQFIQDK